MKRTNLYLVLVLLVSACGPAGDKSGTISACSSTLKALAALTGGLEVPANFQTSNPVKTGGEFDVMQYFKVLDSLSMQPGYTLDYVYHFDGMGGYPLLYVRPTDQPPYTSEADLPASYDRSGYLDFVQVDDTPESYFQLMLLARMGDQFYQYWHAAYADSQIVCDKAGVTTIVSGLNGDFGRRIPPAAWVQAHLLKDIEPTSVVGEQTVEVRLVTFTLWGGFYANTYLIDRSMPHTIQVVEEKNIVPYDCGVMF